MKTLALWALLGVSFLTGCAPSAASLRDRAVAKFEGGHVQQAQGLLAQALERSASDPASLYYMGRVLQAQKKYVQAIYYYRCCLEADPGHAEAKVFMRKAQEEAGMRPES